MSTPKKLRHAVKDDSFPRIDSIKKVVPQWYKNAPTYTEGKKPRFLPQTNLAIKTCIPFLDTLTTGYYIPLVTDIIVDIEEGNPRLSWGVSTPASQRSTSQAPTLPIPEGCSPLHFLWILQTVIELPKGYSALLTHPLNRFDLPFVTLSGIVDGGYALGSGSFPFFIKENFEGVIPRGTPIIQVIPFKTESWVSEEDSSLVSAGDVEARRSMSTAVGWYKHNRWTKKTYD